MLPKLRQRITALTEEKQTLEASLSRAVRAAQEGESTSQSLRVAAHEAEDGYATAEQHAVQQAEQLKQSENQLKLAQARVSEIESREREVKQEWESGKTSNAHALRMVGTLQAETTQAHERANELTVQLRIAQGRLKLCPAKSSLGTTSDATWRSVWHNFVRSYGNSLCSWLQRPKNVPESESSTKRCAWR